MLSEVEIPEWLWKMKEKGIERLSALGMPEKKYICKARNPSVTI